VSQGSLTGESLPIEKFQQPQTGQDIAPTELKNICFMDTSVQSGTAIAVVVSTGVRTYLGSMARSIVGNRVLTSFDRGLNRFTWLMMQFMVVMVPLVFLINGFTKHDWKGAFFFALAVAVGLTPETLPMIVSVCLSKGAPAMSRKRVIVKRLNSIQNFGAMDVLCTAPVLAHPAGDPACLHGSHAAHQSMAAAQAVDLNYQSGLYPRTEAGTGTRAPHQRQAVTGDDPAPLEVARLSPLRAPLYPPDSAPPN